MLNLSLSGGMGSGVSALILHASGVPFRMLFADVGQEDEDVHRFNADIARVTGREIITISTGETPWDVFERRKFIGNSRVAHCSPLLKTKPIMDWLDENTGPEEPLVLGMDMSEQDRIDRAIKTWAPRPVVSVLTAFKVWRPQQDSWLERYGITKPRLYGMGFSHNNCGGACVKAGLAQWKNVLEKMPDRYREHEERMETAMANIGSTARPFLRKSINKQDHYLTLRQFREMVERDTITVDPVDDGEGACGCFTDALV